MKIGKIEHSDDIEDWKSDVTGHWAVCDRCGETVKEAHSWQIMEDGGPLTCIWCGWEKKDTCEVHSVYCGDQTFCYVCGATVGADDAKTVTHESEDDWAYHLYTADTRYHYYGCSCGANMEEGSLEYHEAYCTSPKVCEGCGATNVPMHRIIH